MPVTRTAPASATVSASWTIPGLELTDVGECEPVDPG